MLPRATVTAAGGSYMRAQGQTALVPSEHHPTSKGGQPRTPSPAHTQLRGLARTPQPSLPSQLEGRGDAPRSLLGRKARATRWLRSAPQQRHWYR